MGRGRFIRDSICTDCDLNRLARQEDGEFAVLLFTWMIPCASDSAEITGNPEELRLGVIPGFNRTADDVAAALGAMEGQGLIQWDRVGEKVYFKPESFYRCQSYIRQDKRRSTSSAVTSTTTSTPSSTPTEGNRVVAAYETGFGCRLDEPERAVVAESFTGRPIHLIEFAASRARLRGAVHPVEWVNTALEMWAHAGVDSVDGAIQYELQELDDGWRGGEDDDCDE